MRRINIYEKEREKLVNKRSPEIVKRRAGEGERESRRRMRTKIFSSGLYIAGN